MKPTGVYLKRFGHREDNKCWWCGDGGGRTAAQTREHLFRHCSRWRDQQNALWEAVGKATGWKSVRCRHVQISKLFSVEECDQAVMDLLEATEVGKFPPKCMTVWRRRRGWLRRGGGSDGGLYRFLFVPFLFSPCVPFIFAFAFVLSLNFHIYQWG